MNKIDAVTSICFSFPEEYVGTKASVDKFIFFETLDDQLVLRNKCQWPRDNDRRCYSMPTELQNPTTDKFVYLASDVAFFDDEHQHCCLMIPIRQENKTNSNPLGFLSFVSIGSVVWTDKQSNLLELARDLIETTIHKSSIFRNIDQRIANMNVDEINDCLSTEQSQTIEHIVVLFEQIRRHSKINDLWQSIGIDAFKTKLARFLLGNQMILMVLPAFPFKNRNENANVTGPLPDMGEVLALDNLNRFAGELSKIYAPGCTILIVSDGRVFNDIYPVPDTVVSNYTNQIHSLNQDHLRFIGLDELFSSLTDNNDKRQAIVQLYDADMASVDRKLKRDAHFRDVYVSFKRYLRKDVAESRSSITAKAKLMMMRNESYSELIRVLFPHHVRLSIHDHNSLEKIGIHLVGDSVITPWHGVPVKRRNGTWTIMKKKQALQIGCVLEDLMVELANVNNSLGQEVNSMNLSQNRTFTSLLFYREL